MPCHKALQKNILSVSPSDQIEEVLLRLEKSEWPFAVVLNQDSEIQGYISYAIILENLLPVSVAMQNGIELDVSVSETPGIAKRFKHIQVLPVSDFMKRDVMTLHPNSSIGEGVNALVKKGEPVFVVEENTDKLVGVLDSFSAIKELGRMAEVEE